MKCCVRALSRMIIGDATKALEGEDTNIIFFSLYFSVKQSHGRGLGNLVGLMIPLHQQTATQIVNS